MAVVRTKEKTTLTLQYDNGIADGKQMLIKANYSNVKTDAIEQAIYDTAKAIEGLQDKDMLNVVVNDLSSLNDI